MKEYLLFDLDGTLTDPKIGITTCVQYALKEFGIEEPDLDKLEPFIGPPLKNSFMEFYGFTEEQADRAVEKYRERFSELGMYENEVYAGIPQMLRSLQSCGMFLAVASSKPTVYVEKILEHFDLRKYFKVVVGSELDGTRVDKEEVVMEALRQLFAYKPIQYAKVYMIGDRKYDVEGAKKIGVESVGVTYGYGSMEELKEAHADYIVRSVDELKSLLMREGEALKQAREEKQQGGQDGTQKKKGFMQVMWPLLYPMIMFVLVRSIASNVVLMMLQMLGTSIKGPVAEWLFVYDETGALSALTGNSSAIFNSLTYIIAAAFLLKQAKTVILKTKETEKLKHLKADSTKSYVLFGIVTISAVVGLNILFELAQVTQKAEAYQALVEDEYSANLFWGIVSSGILIPIVEELVFRGLVYNQAKKTYKVQQAMLMSALLYGLISGDSVQGVYCFVLGCLLAYSYEYFGSFLAPVVIHVVAGILTYVITYTPIVNTALYSLPMCGLFLVVAVVAIRMITKEKKLW